MYTNEPVQKFSPAWFWSFCHLEDQPPFWFVREVHCLSWTVKLFADLLKNPLGFARYLLFHNNISISEPFQEQQQLYDPTTVTKAANISLVLWLRAGCVYFWASWTICSALQKSIRYLDVYTEDKIITMYTNHPVQKFTPWPKGHQPTHPPTQGPLWCVEIHFSTCPSSAFRGVWGAHVVFR